MAWLTTFTFLCCAAAAGLFVPGAIMDYIPSCDRTADLYLRTSRAVAIIAMVAALIFSLQSMRMAG
jgi:hypothetical protein